MDIILNANRKMIINPIGRPNCGEDRVNSHQFNIALFLCFTDRVQSFLMLVDMFLVILDGLLDVLLMAHLLLLQLVQLLLTLKQQSYREIKIDSQPTHRTCLQSQSTYESDEKLTKL